MRKEDTMTKEPACVVHDREQLEQYVQQMIESEGITFDQWIVQYGAGFYLRRNQALLELLRPLRPRRVFEFACAGGFLADLLLENIDTIELYTCSNFSPKVVAYCKAQLARHQQCEVRLIDADVMRTNDITPVRLANYDTIVTTSFE